MQYTFHVYCKYICLHLSRIFYFQLLEYIYYGVYSFYHILADPREEAYDNMYMGCYGEDSTNRDVEFQVWDRTETNDASIENCVHTCQTQAFVFAALQVSM